VVDVGKEEVIQQLVPQYKIDAFAKLHKTSNYVIPGHLVFTRA
jgi:hypothetical protein